MGPVLLRMFVPSLQSPCISQHCLCILSPCISQHRLCIFISYHSLCICPYLQGSTWLSFLISISHAEMNPFTITFYPPMASHHPRKQAKPGKTRPCYSIHLSFMLRWTLHFFTLDPLCLVFSSGKLTPWHLPVGVLFVYQVSAQSSHRTLPNHLVGSRFHCSSTVASLLVLFASIACLLCCVRSMLKVLLAAT